MKSKVHPTFPVPKLESCCEDGSATVQVPALQSALRRAAQSVALLVLAALASACVGGLGGVHLAQDENNSTQEQSGGAGGGDLAQTEGDEAPESSPAAEESQRATSVAAPQNAGVPSGEQSASSPTSSGDLDAFIEVVDVHVVNIEVHVVDKRGQRITGLTREDFELYEDDKPVAITNFYAIQDGRGLVPGEEDPAAGQAVEDETGLPQRGRLGLQPVDLGPEEQRLHLVIYVDHFNLRPFNRNRVLRAARQFLRTQLSPEDEVLLLAYNRSLKEIHPFTRDKDLIANSLFELEEVTAYGVHYDSDRRDMMRAIYDSDEAYQVQGRVSQYAESINNDLQFSLDALSETLDRLAGLPGRKAVLYISDGMAMIPGEDVFHAMDDKFRDSQNILEAYRFNAYRDFQQLTNKANASRVSFYTIDASGLRSYTYLDASNANPDGGARIDQVHFENVQSSIRFLARETGGKSMLNSNDFAGLLEGISEDFKTYYSLGYSPSTVGDGRYRELKVRLKNSKACKGCKVRHRRGYRDKPVNSRVADTTMAALFFGYQKNELDLRLAFGEGEEHESGHVTVAMQVQIPLDKLSFLPVGEGTQRSRLRLFVASRDDEGGVAEVTEVPVDIEIPTDELEQAKGQRYGYTLNMLMRRGSQRVAVGVRDEVSSDTSYVIRGINVG